MYAAKRKSENWVKIEGFAQTVSESREVEKPVWAGCNWDNTIWDQSAESLSDEQIPPYMKEMS